MLFKSALTSFKPRNRASETHRVSNWVLRGVQTASHACVALTPLVLRIYCSHIGNFHKRTVFVGVIRKPAN
jgi:hypothetical protein